MIPLTGEEFESHDNLENCHISGEMFGHKYADDTKELEIIVIILVNTKVLYIAYVMYKYNT